MTESIAKNQCYLCGKQTRIFNCDGCLQNYCHIDLTKHLQALSKQLDEIENDHDILRQKLLDQKANNFDNCLLIQQINKWEYDSIEKIQQRANQYREKLIKYINKSFLTTEKHLNELAQQIRDIHNQNGFNEIEIIH